MRGSTAGLADSLKDTSPKYYVFLGILDNLFSALVVAPAVVGYWRSVWKLTIWYLFPSSKVTAAFVSLSIGMAGHLIFGLSQDKLSNYFHPDRHRIAFYCVSRVYTACYAFTCVNSWRGIWDLLDLYTDGELSTILSITFISIVLLASMRVLKNVCAAPFVIVTDSVNGFFEIPTMFKAMNSNKTYLFVLDTLFSIFIVGTLVVFVWRGGWVLIDRYLYPNDFKLSAWISLTTGYTIAIISFCLQPILKGVCDKLTGYQRIIVADLFLFFSFLGTINAWRGIWNLLDYYFLPDHPEMSCWLIGPICLTMLILLNCANSLLVRGVYIDGEEPAGKCAIFPCYYLRLIFKNERATREHQKLLKSFAETRKEELQCLTTFKDNGACYKEQNHVIVIQNMKPNHIEV